MKSVLDVTKKKLGRTNLFELELDLLSTRRRSRTPSRVGALELPWCRWSVCNRVPPLDACAASAADLTITDHSSRETNLRTERSTRRRPRTPSRVGALEPPWCRWSVCNRVPPLDACAASTASLLNRASRLSLRDSQVGPRRSRHTRRADKPTCTPTNNTTAVPARPRDGVRGLLRAERLCGRSIVWR